MSNKPRKRSLPNSKVRVNKKRKYISGGRKSEKRQSFLNEYKPKTFTVNSTSTNKTINDFDIQLPRCWQPDGTYGWYTGHIETDTLCPPGYIPRYGDINFVQHEHHTETSWSHSYEHGQCVCEMMTNQDSAGGQGGRAGR